MSINSRVRLWTGSLASSPVSFVLLCIETKIQPLFHLRVMSEKNLLEATVLIGSERWDIRRVRAETFFPSEEHGRLQCHIIDAWFVAEEKLGRELSLLMKDLLSWSIEFNEQQEDPGGFEQVTSVTRRVHLAVIFPQTCLAGLEVIQRTS